MSVIKTLQRWQHFLFLHNSSFLSS